MYRSGTIQKENNSSVNRLDDTNASRYDPSIIVYEDQEFSSKGSKRKLLSNSQKRAAKHRRTPDIQHDTSSLESDPMLSLNSSRNIHKRSIIEEVEENSQFIKIDVAQSKVPSKASSKCDIRKSLDIKAMKDATMNRKASVDFRKTQKNQLMRLDTKMRKFKFGKTLDKKPPLVPKNPLWKEIQLQDDLKYV